MKRPFDKKRGLVLDQNLDMGAGDFETMMDDQHGEPAIRLSFADQARFAAETIRRIHANGRLGNMVYGGGR